MPIPVLVLIELLPEQQRRLRESGFDLHLAAAERERAVAEKGPIFRAVLTNGSTGLTAAEMERMPALEMVCAQGAGFERIDVAAARARGLTVTHGPGTNDSSVADHAMALLLAAARGIVRADAAVRRGEWPRLTRPAVFGKRLGILGLGRIGAQIAQRGAAGFGMAVGYHARQPREGVEHAFFASPTALATWCDFLVIATPGGPGTRGLVDAAVLQALGPQGFLINIARGTVVDTAALILALREGRIAGAALDVVEGEPKLPEGLAELENVTLTPHVAGRSPEAVMATIGLVIENLTAHFAGRPVLTPVPA
ncbi:2-hydroxyacid dehydrogenase [Roseomonas indoligenes]|uniref:2-hydroxyacid dehydrogenase n=1 Tax=Roseomonas indoligenes TaxID=2820811 RepID=A0A940N3D8_9PROT|nr:2-hydroxyacid dehydrogenase [Pararoseomonas indoligenes]MBP0495977.1 2-hydroxyacid dehydrogenase [Pararoseomonas indoligenes]